MKLAAMRVIEGPQPLDEVSKYLKGVQACLDKMMESQEGSLKNLSFVEATVSGLKFSALVDTGATPILVSKKIVPSLHSSLGFNQSRFKALDSEVKSVMSRVNATPLRLGIWNGKLDLEVVSLDDHSMILGQYFLWSTCVTSVPHVGRFMFLGGSRERSFSMMQKRKLGWWPRMSSVQILEEPSKFINLAQCNIRQTQISVKEDKKSTTKEVGHSLVKRVASLEERMESIRSEVESFCISIDTLQQNGGDSFLATTQSVGFIVGSTLEMLSSNNDDDG